MRARAFAAGVVLGALAWTPPAQAQDALVLSGGAARGLAHAGVVQGLDRRGFDPDVVTGTSMGAVVGALYASGYSADSIVTLVRIEDWRALFTPLPVTVGGARAIRHPVLRLRMERAQGFGTRGYLPDWRVNRELTRFLFEPGARARGDFDRLPRRFRAVAVDLRTGELVVPDRGDLARAVRASAAQPGFFPPVDWGGHRLVDGGVRDYLPVATARGLGGRRVVASDVIRPRAMEDDNAFAAAARSLDYLTVHGRPADEAPDVLLLPAVDPTASPIVYPTDPTPFVRAGLEAVARSTLPDLGRPAPARAGAPLPGRLGVLELPGADPRIERFVRRAFGRAAPGAFDTRTILARVDRLYETGLFDGVWVSVEEAQASAEPPLVARVDPRAPLALLGAVGYDIDRGGRAWLSLRRIVRWGGAPLEAALEGSTDGIVKSGAFSLRLPGLALAWTAGAELSETRARSFTDVHRAGGWLGVEARRIDPNRYASLTLRAERIRSTFGPDGNAWGPSLRAGSVPPLVQFVGIPTMLDAEARVGDVEYRRVRVQAARVLGPVRSRLAPLAAFEAASSGAPIDRAPALGDDELVPALRRGELRARRLAVAGLDLSHVLPRRATLVLRTRAGWTDRPLALPLDPHWILGTSLSTLWWLPLGRIEVGLEGNTRGDRQALVRVGADF